MAIEFKQDNFHLPIMKVYLFPKDLYSIIGIGSVPSVRNQQAILANFTRSLVQLVRGTRRLRILVVGLHSFPP